jgi:hypothetical protein
MTRLKRPVLLACSSIVLLGLGGPARAQGPASADAPRPADAKRSAWLHEVYLRDASDYEFFLDAGHRRKLALRREPVMRWASESDYRGEVFVWTHDGRPGVVGCVFSGPQAGRRDRNVMHEFHSLAPVPLVGGGTGASRWEPHEPGVTLEPVPDAGEPASGPARRLAEMRELVRRFSAHMTSDDRTWELRLLPQPIYRYEPAGEGSDVIDGAVFSYVWTIGTDPEVLLVLEARRDAGRTRWHYAPARFTNREAWLKYRDREVWRVGAATTGIFDGVTSKPYGAFMVKTISPPADEP